MQSPHKQSSSLFHRSLIPQLYSFFILNKGDKLIFWMKKWMGNKFIFLCKFFSRAGCTDLEKPIMKDYNFFPVAS